jgi:hypothetical protein
VRASKQPPPRAETLREKEKKGIAAGDLGEAGSKLSKSQLWALRRREGGGRKVFSFRLLACSHYFILVTVAAATPPSSKSPDSTLSKNGAIPPLRRHDSSIDLRGERGTR